MMADPVLHPHTLVITSDAARRCVSGGGEIWCPDPSYAPGMGSVGSVALAIPYGT